jgi:predicted nucleic acid-binding protein
VVRWISGQPAASLYVASITLAEILHGVALLPPGRRRDAIQAAAESMFEVEFGGHVLPFDGVAARACAGIAAARRHAGRPITNFDAQIAATALVARAAFATRNVSDFEGCGLKLLNPWDR